MDYKKAFEDLTNEEMMALYAHCNDWDLQRTLTFINTSQSQYYYYLSSARVKLGIKKAHSSAMEKEEKENHLPEIIREVVHSDEEAKNWQPHTHTRNRGGRNVPPWLPVAGGAFVAVFCLGGFIFFVLFITRQYANLFGPQPTAVNTVQAASLPAPVVLPTATIFFTPTFTLTPTITPTFTLTPTFTSTFTPTVTFTPSITPNYLFFTDFANKEIPPGLNRENGNLFFNDKGMTTYGKAAFSIGDPSWVNYKIELFVSGVNTCDKGLDIGVREITSVNMMLFAYRNCNVKWISLKGGYLPMTNLDIPALDSRRIEITVKGDQYSSISSVGTADHPKGGVYITMLFDVTIEYIKITKLP